MICCCAGEQQRSFSKVCKPPLSVTHPALALQWHPTLNPGLSPDTLTAGSPKKVTWLCNKSACQHPHVWSATVKDRSRAGRGSGCPFCIGRKWCPCTSLAGRFPAVAAEWHPTRNADLRPEDVAAFSSERVWWMKQLPSGEVKEWQATVHAQTSAFQNVKIKLSRAAVIESECP